MEKLMKKGVLMIVTAVTIILIIIMGVTLGGRTRVSAPENIIGKVVVPIQKLFYKSGQVVENSFTSLFSFRAIARENKSLKKEVEKLNKEVIKLSLKRDELEELTNLSKALNFVKVDKKYRYVSASVTGKDVGNWFNIFCIDAGRNQGITKNGIVINGEGLIGKVFEVGDNWAKIVAIVDNKSSVSFEVLRNNQFVGVIRGSVQGKLTGYLIDPQAEILAGDKLITSGLSVYPKGIPIGEVKEVIKKKNDLLKTIIVRPTVNFKKIDKVLILIPE